jgi:hypothetical protein
MRRWQRRLRECPNCTSSYWKRQRDLNSQTHSKSSGNAGKGQAINVSSRGRCPQHWTHGKDGSDSSRMSENAPGSRCWAAISLRGHATTPEAQLRILYRRIRSGGSSQKSRSIQSRLWRERPSARSPKSRIPQEQFHRGWVCQWLWRPVNASLKTLGWD